jgi:hypothetical protein
MDLDSAEGSGRTADGRQYRDRIRAGVRRLRFGFGPLKWSDLSTIYQLMEDEYFEVTYPDPYSGQFETRTFQVGDRESPYLVSRGDEIYWSGFRFNLVER